MQEYLRREGDNANSDECRKSGNPGEDGGLGTSALIHARSVRLFAGSSAGGL